MHLVRPQCHVAVAREQARVCGCSRTASEATRALHMAAAAPAASRARASACFRWCEILNCITIEKTQQTANNDEDDSSELDPRRWTSRGRHKRCLRSTRARRRTARQREAAAHRQRGPVCAHGRRHTRRTLRICSSTLGRKWCVHGEREMASRGSSARSYIAQWTRRFAHQRRTTRRMTRCHQQSKVRATCSMFNLTFALAALTWLLDGHGTVIRMEPTQFLLRTAYQSSDRKVRRTRSLVTTPRDHHRLTDFRRRSWQMTGKRESADNRDAASESALANHRPQKAPRPS